MIKEVIIGWFPADSHSTTCDMKERIDMGRKFLGIASLRLGLQMGVTRTCLRVSDLEQDVRQELIS